MSFIESLCDYITPTTVAIYILIHILTYVICITYQSNHIINADPELNKRFPCFARSDTHRWGIIKCFPYYIQFWPRFLSVCVIIVIYTLWVWIIMTGHVPGKPLHPIRRILTKKPGQWLPRILIMFGNVYWIKIERPKYDYSVYLGPDWKPTYENASTYVVNHTIWIDILIFMWWNLPSFVSKKEIRNWPGVGRIAESIQSLFLERGGTKEQNKTIIKQISDRQKLSEQGLVPPLIVYPEGCTSNGKYLLQFKKGTFVGENSIQPFAFEYYSPIIDVSHDVMGNFAQFVLCCMVPYISVTIREYPVFKPNEYFWKHHYDPSKGQARWEVFANTIRKIIQSSHNLILYEMSMEDKLEYRALLEGKTPRPRRAEKDD